MTAEPLPSRSKNDDSNSMFRDILVRLAVIERLINDHLKYHDKSTNGNRQLQVQGLMFLGIVVDVILHFKGAH